MSHRPPLRLNDSHLALLASVDLSEWSWARGGASTQGEAPWPRGTPAQTPDAPFLKRVCGAALMAHSLLKHQERGTAFSSRVFGPVGPRHSPSVARDHETGSGTWGRAAGGPPSATVWGLLTLFQFTNPFSINARPPPESPPSTPLSSNPSWRPSCFCRPTGPRPCSASSRGTPHNRSARLRPCPPR